MGSINFLEQAFSFNSSKMNIESDVQVDKLNDIIVEITNEIVSKHGKIVREIKSKNAKKTSLESKIIEIMDEKQIYIPNMTRDDFIKRIMDEVFGYSILQKYIEDPEVNDIMVNDYNKIFIRKHLTDYQVPEVFYSPEVYKQFLYKVCAFIGKKLNDSSPIVDGSDTNYNLRINITSQPINTYAPSLVIRKNHKNLDLSKVISIETYPQEVLDTIDLIAKAGCRVMFAGPLESGKTTAMNAYLNRIDKRIVVMEDTPEVHLDNPNTIYMQTVDGKGEDAVTVTLADLVRNFKRTNGNMPVVSEVRGIEAVELLDIFNAGFIFGATSIHANSPIDVIRQLVFQIKASDKLGTDRDELEEYIGRTIDIIIYMEKRKFINISEVYYDYDKKRIEIRDLHRYNIEREDKNNVYGKYEVCINPFSKKMLDRIRRAGLIEKVPSKMK